MRWPLRNQIFVPTAGLLLLAVVVVSLVTAASLFRQTRILQVNRLRSVTAALGDADFPLTDQVVRRIGLMVGGEVVVADRKQVITATTLTQHVARNSALRDLLAVRESSTGRITVNRTGYIFAAIPRLYAARPGTLIVLIPEARVLQLQREAVVPPLIAAGVALFPALAFALWFSRRMGARMKAMAGLFQQLACGHFDPVSVPGPDDELADLHAAANTLSVRLQEMQRELANNERLALLSQLSGGLAHQLKNSLTGARLAIQLRQRREKKAGGSCDLLATAESQLRLTEAQVNAVLSLRSSAHPEPAPASIHASRLFREVQQLLLPQANHFQAEVVLEVDDSADVMILKYPQAVRGALLNLALNGLEAAGANGRLILSAHRESGSMKVGVCDDGPGFTSDAETMTAPFRTSKPEGIGLGLTIARHAAEQEGGSLEIDRQEGLTRVTLVIPGLLSPEGRHHGTCSGD